MRSVAGSFVLLAATAPALLAQPAPVSAGADFFETKIRPLFVEKCYACHTETRMGGLQLDSREHFLKGGKSGPIAVPGDPDASLIVKALRYDGDRKMPPTGKLAADQIAAVEAWVRAGAMWPEHEKAALKSPPYLITAEQRAFWSFQPVKAVAPPEVKDGNWDRTEIDRFIASKLEAGGLHPVRRADRRTLIRRATYDLTGLPPTFEEVDAFERDRSTDAFAKVIDGLLASPRYGERWGRLWLDVARYSDDRLDSERDNPYPASFRYRDWVIQAIQDDMPYDVFVKAQIAGDQLPNHEKYEAGLGFYALSPEMQDDRVDATTRGFLGLTVACAQCHDHKYDPIPTRDFYSLMGIFRNTDLHEVPLAPKATVDAFNAQKALIEKKEKELKEYVDAQSAQLGLILASETARYLLASGQPSSKVNDTTASTTVATTAGTTLDPGTLARWTKYLAEPEKQHPFLKDWFAATTQDQRAKAAAEFQAQVLAVIAEKNRVDDENHIRLGLNPSRNDLSNANLVSLDRAKFGLWEDMLGDRGVLHYGDAKEEDARIDRFLAGVWLSHLTQLRAQLAALKKDLPPAYPALQTIADKAKPAEQHVWIRGDQHNPGDLAPPHFLAILSPADPERFQRGKERLELAEAIANPANPLTARVIVNRVWQQHFGYGLVRTASNFGSQGDRPSHPELLDYLADRFVREGWSLKKLHREIMLTAVYGLSADASDRNYAEDPDNRLLWRYNRRRLDAESLRDSLLYVSGKLDLQAGGPAVRLDKDNNRRTVYAYISRRQLDPVLALFDFPNPNGTSEQRLQTTVPLQKLFFMNSPFVIAQSAALTARVAANATSDDQRITATYRFVLQRDPTPEERRLAREFIGGNPGAWPEYTQVLLSSNEFTYLD